MDRRRSELLRGLGLAAVVVLALGSCGEEAVTGMLNSAHRLIAPGGVARREASPTPDEGTLTRPPIPLTAALQSPSTPYATVWTDVRIRFEGALNLTLSHFSIDPQVDGRLNWLDPQTLRFQPDRLAFDTAYAVQVSVVGHSVWSWQFTTIKPITISIDDCASTGGELRTMLTVLAQWHLTAIHVSHRHLPAEVPMVRARHGGRRATGSATTPSHTPA